MPNYRFNKPIGDVEPGKFIKIGNREFVVLGQSARGTAIITKDFAKKMQFGSDGVWETSAVREYCNGEFLDEIRVAVGRENIVEHIVELMAEDGSGEEKIARELVSVLTTHSYRRYRKFLTAMGDWWWLANQPTVVANGYARSVCYVNSYGVLCWGGCGYDGGVRPFLILDSSVLVSCDE